MRRRIIKIKSKIKEMPKKENEVDKEQLYKYALEWAKFKYNEEVRREDSIIKQSSNMQMAFSFIIAALFMAIPIIVQYRGKLSLEFCMVAFSTIVVALMLCLLFATIAQKRKAQVMMDYVENQTKEIVGNPKYFATNTQRLKYSTDFYAQMEKSLHNNNRNRVKCVRISMVFFYISLGLCAFWFATAVCLLIFS